MVDAPLPPTPELDPGFDAGFAPVPTPQPAPVAMAPTPISAPSTPVNVYSPEGELVSVDSNNLSKATSQGFTQATPDQVDEHFLQQKYGGVGGELKAAAEGAANAATFGGATAIEKMAGRTDEDILGTRKANPIAYGGGELLGLGASAVVPGLGEASAAKLLGEGGAAAAELLGLGGETAGLMSKLGAKTVSEAAQMAAYQGGSEISKLIVNDPEQSAQSAISDIGMAALLGAGTGAAFGTVAPLWKATVGDKASQIAADFKGRFEFHLNNPDPAGAMAEELGKHQEAMEGIRKEVYGVGGLKQEALQKLLPLEATPEIQRSTNEFISRIEGVAADMRGASESYSSSQVRALENVTQGVSDKLSPKIGAADFLSGVRPESGTSFDHFTELEKVKRQLQDLANYNGPPLVRGSQEANFLGKVRSLASEARTNLENPEVWGKAGEMQRDLNAAAAKAIKPTELFGKRFMAVSGDGTKVVDPGKIATFIKQLGKPSAEIKQDVLQTYLKESQSVRDEVSKIYQKLGQASPVETHGLSVTNTLLEKSTAGSRLADAAIHEGLETLVGKTVGGGVGAAAGNVVAGRWGATAGALFGEHILGKGISKLVHPMIRPIMDGIANGAGLKAGADYVGVVARGQKTLGDAAAAVFKNIEKPIISGISTATVRNRERLNDAVVKAQTDPSFLTNVGADVGHYLPHHATAMAQTATNSLNFLNTQRPDTGPKMPLDSKLPPEPGKAANYNRMLDIANNPVSIMPKIASGAITPQEITGLKTMYPGLYNTMVAKLMDEMNNHLAKGNSIPYRTKIGLSMFAGQPMDSTMTPASIVAAQPKPSPSNQPQGGSPGKPPSQSSTKGISKLSSTYQTADQTRDERSQKP